MINRSNKGKELYELLEPLKEDGDSNTIAAIVMMSDGEGASTHQAHCCMSHHLELLTYGVLQQIMGMGGDPRRNLQFLTAGVLEAMSESVPEQAENTTEVATTTATYS